MPTSRYDSSIKVKQEVIDRIKKMGMSSAVEAANSGKESAEFVEGAKRFYGNRVGAKNPANLAKRQQETKVSGRAAPSVGDKDTGEEKKSTPMPPSAPAAASRRTEKKSTAEQALGRRNVESVKKVTQPVASGISKAGAAIAAQRAMNVDKVGSALKGAGKKLGLNNPFKPRKRK